MVFQYMPLFAMFTHDNCILRVSLSAYTFNNVTLHYELQYSIGYTLTVTHLFASGFILEKDCDLCDVEAGQEGQLGCEELVNGWHQTEEVGIGVVLQQGGPEREVVQLRRRAKKETVHIRVSVRGMVQASAETVSKSKDTHANYQIEMGIVLICCGRICQYHTKMHGWRWNGYNEWLGRVAFLKTHAYSLFTQQKSDTVTSLHSLMLVTGLRQQEQQQRTCKLSTRL